MQRCDGAPAYSICLKAIKGTDALLTMQKVGTKSLWQAACVAKLRWAHLPGAGFVHLAGQSAAQNEVIQTLMSW